jgi:hypothetical protein
MGITVEWDDPDQTILRTTFNKPWDWTDWDRAITEATQHVNSVSHPLCLIQDLREAGFPPKGGTWRFRQVVSTMQPHVKKVVFIGMASFVQSLLDIVSLVNRGRAPTKIFGFARSLEEARVVAQAALETVVVQESPK